MDELMMIGDCMDTAARLRREIDVNKYEISSCITGEIAVEYKKGLEKADESLSDIADLLSMLQAEIIAEL